jgi:hypothetical protein
MAQSGMSADSGVLQATETEGRMNFAVSLWQLVQQDKLVRLGAYGSIGVVWFALAWADSRLLLALPLLALGIWIARRVRGEQEEDDDFDLL